MLVPLGNWVWDGCKGQDKRDSQAGPTGVIWIVDCGWAGEKTHNLSRIEF